MQLTLDLLREMYSICRLPPDAELPAGAFQSPGFSSVSRTAEELSIICPADDAPADVAQRSDGWRALKIRGPLDLSTSGILLKALLPLGERRIPVFSVATFDTDYLFVREQDLMRAVEALRSAGHLVHADTVLGGR